MSGSLSLDITNSKGVLLSIKLPLFIKYKNTKVLSLIWDSCAKKTWELNLFVFQKELGGTTLK